MQMLYLNQKSKKCKAKKLLSLSFAALLMMSCLSGCDKANSTSFPILEKSDIPNGCEWIMYKSIPDNVLIYTLVTQPTNENREFINSLQAENEEYIKNCSNF